MAYQDDTQYNSPAYTVGRAGNGISGITIHHWGDPNQNPTYEGVISYLCRAGAQTSAHYVITGTGRRCACIVAPQNTAWHAGNWNANLTTIGLELDPRARDEDYDVAAEVIADLWKHYGRKPLYPHKHWVATACPGRYDLGRLEREAVDKLNGVKKTVRPTADEVKAVYREELKREADSGGLKVYVGNGWTVDRLRQELRGSSEYKTLQARLAAEKAAQEAAAKQKAAEEAKKKEQEAAKAAAEKAQAEADKKAQEYNDAATEEMREALRLAKENNSLIKQLIEFLKGIFK